MYLTPLPDLNANPDRNRPEVHYKLLKKLPAIHEAFFRKKVLFFPIYTTLRYFVVKSRYLLCYSKRETELALEYQKHSKETNQSVKEGESPNVASPIGENCNTPGSIESVNSSPSYNLAMPRSHILNYSNTRKTNLKPHEQFTPKHIIELNYCKIYTREDKEKEKYYIHIDNSWGKSLVLLTNDKYEYEFMFKVLSEASIKPNKADFKYICVLGKGSFGEVTLVLHIPTNTEYAMKKAYIESPSLLQHQLEERAIFERVSGHPFVVKLLYAFQEDRTLYYVQQYCSGGDLYGLLRRRGKFPEYVVQFYFAEILLALKHLHSHQILHRDIKPENILLDGSGHALLTDFGLSKILNERTRTNSLCGTELYYAPELYKRDEQGYDFSVDFWQLGCTIFELLTEKPPFYGKSKPERITKILSEDPIYPDYLSQEVVQLLSFLLKKDPFDRPDCVESIQRMNFFAGIDWDKLYRREIEPPKWDVDEKELKQYISDTRPLNPKYHRMDTDWQLDVLGFDYSIHSHKV